MARGFDHAVALKLASSGFGTFTVDIFAGEIPSRPDNAIGVTSQAGGRVVNLVQEEQIVEVRVRNTSYETAWDLASQISALLHDAQGNFGSQGIIAKMLAASTPTPLGRDSGQNGGRFEVIQTFTAVLKQGLTTTV